MRPARGGRAAAACWTALLVAWLGARPEAAVRSVAFRTQDGVTIAGRYYEPLARSAPAILLIHMLTRSSADWVPAATELSDAGFAVLAIDLRGHGASAGTAPTVETGDASPLLLDVRAALGFLEARPEVTPGRIGICGASIGANLAMLAAADDAAVFSIALLSPGLDYLRLRIEAATRKYGPRPALLVVGSNDPYAVRSVRQLTTLGPGPREVMTLPSAGHGTTLLARAPELLAALVDWFRRTLL